MLSIISIILAFVMLGGAGTLIYLSSFRSWKIPSPSARTAMISAAVVLVVGGIACGKYGMAAPIGFWQSMRGTEQVQAAEDEPETETPKAGAETEESETEEAKLETDEDFIQVKLSLDELTRLYGHLRGFFRRGTTPALAADRAVLAGFEDAVNLPSWADLAWFDIRDGLVREDADLSNVDTSKIGRRPNMTEKQWKEDLEKQVKVWKEAYAALTTDEKISQEYDWVILNIINDPVYCDAWAQAFAVDPEIVRQNPWLTEGLKRWDEYYDVTGKDLDKDLVGQERALMVVKGYEATVQALDAEEAWKQLAYVGDTDEQFYYAARVAALFEYFTPKGFEAKESWKNWHMPVCADLALTRTEEADYQESKTALVLWNRDKELKTRIEIGVNALDGRPIIYQTTVHKTKDTTPETPATTTKPPKTTPNPTPNNTPTVDPKLHTVVVHYRYRSNGKDIGKAADDKRQTGYEGESYDILSPSIEGWKASEERKSGRFSKTYLEFTVYYDKINEPTPGPGPDPTPVAHNLDIRYLYKENGQTAAPAHHETLTKGQGFSVNSPDVSGYTPDMARIAGTMGDADLSYTVYYIKNETPTTDPDPEPRLYHLHISYQYEDGSQAAAPVDKDYAEGTSYKFDSAVIDGYTADRSVVQGTMPAHDVNEVVIYRPKDGNGGKDPEEEPAQTGEGGDRGGGDNSDDTYGVDDMEEKAEEEESERQKDEEAERAAEEESKRQEEEDKNVIKDQEGGESFGNERPEISNQNPDTEISEDTSAKEEEVIDNGDGTTTTVETEVKPADETADGELKLDD